MESPAGALGAPVLAASALLPGRCTKVYRDIPFAHRQPAHTGHCQHVHGHNWAFTFTFAARSLDECGFVVDFGKLDALRALVGVFDHALVLAEDDPELSTFRFLEGRGLCRIVLVPNPSCEGLAEHLLKQADELVQSLTAGRVRVESVEVSEDTKNSASAAWAFVFPYPTGAEDASA